MIRIADPERFLWHEACLPPACAGHADRRHHASRRRQVKKVDHYWLSVDAMTKPMTVREDPSAYRAD